MSVTGNTTQRNRVSSVLIPLGMVVLVVGMSEAMAVPFLSLFLSTAVHAGPLQITVFLIANPVAGVVVATLIGRLSDRRAIRRGLLIIAAVAGFAGSCVTAFVRDYGVLLALTATASALSGSLFPQTFAYARQVLTGDGSNRAVMGISTLRTIFSFAWVAGPPLATLLLHFGFGYLYGTNAVLYLAAGLVALLWLRPIGAPATIQETGANTVEGGEPGAGQVVERERPRYELPLTVVAFTLLQVPLTLGVQALPLFVSRDLGGKVTDAGLILGLCAALEIPIMLTLGALSSRVNLRLLLFVGGACGIAYYSLAATTSGVPLLAAGQIVNAVFIAAISGLGISYMQELLPRHPGRATTLFTNTVPIGAMLTGPLFGLSQHFGFRLAYTMGAALCTAGLLLLVVSGSSARRT